MLAEKISQNDFNSIEYINRIFPNEQSLSNIDEVLRILKDKIWWVSWNAWYFDEHSSHLGSFLDNEIRNVICSQKSVEENGRKTLEDAQKLILTLTNVIKEIKTQAKQSEKIVKHLRLLFILPCKTYTFIFFPLDRSMKLRAISNNWTMQSATWQRP